MIITAESNRLVALGGDFSINSNNHSKKQIRTNFDLRNSSDLLRLVELRRIELLSEKTLIRLSPGADCLLDLPCVTADSQAVTLGSFFLYDRFKS